MGEALPMNSAERLVERIGFEPTTSSVRGRHSPCWSDGEEF